MGVSCSDVGVSYFNVYVLYRCAWVLCFTECLCVLDCTVFFFNLDNLRQLNDLWVNPSDQPVGEPLRPTSG